MPVFLHRTTKELRPYGHTPDFDTADWIHDPDLSSVTGVEKRFWMITGDTVQPMTGAEKDANHLPAIRTDKEALIDRRTRELIDGGFEYPASSGVYFSLSAESQRTLMGLNQERDAVEIAYPVVGNSKDDTTTVALAAAADIRAFYFTALGTVRAHKDSGTALKDQVRAATTVAAVNAVADAR